ncbi:hypothetical protein [Peloplasma aerotolerans]|uniref:DUF31 domain-containing protein n=1 Tax=Peloplasma aerotolerans TaxID=3044389 RepID=A0AAW6U7Q4_9MOLU|nr:hypothetical protein [Mariniplasma sp. M4Ah]MDI6452103.1 hypothetical protein [Mariniplasma sp. M4Ah]MDR4968320.1 hypothetical protein [Acholeplasmataceae bacterium]
MIELRTANSKTFQTDDGSGKMVLYNHDVHFFENGKYNDIDMSLVKNKNKNTYQTKNSNYQVSLPETLAKGNLIEVQHQDSSIKFYYPNSIESNFSVSNDLGSKGIEKAQSQLTYNNIKSNTDLVLDLSPTQLKESFVLSEYVEDFKVDYYLILNNLSMVSLEDASLIFINPQGEIIFEFEPYFMFDSNEVYSDDVTVTFEEVFKGFYRFQVKPNQKWLMDSDREYPVIIDPIVNFKMNTTNQFMRDKYCYVGSASCTDNSYFRVQYDDLYFVEPQTETLVFSLIELNAKDIYDNIMSIYNNSSYTSIDDIKLKLHIKENQTPTSGILVQDISDPLSYDSMNGISDYDYLDIDVLSGSGSFYEFNIDNEIYKHNMLEESLTLRLYPRQPFVRYSTRFYASNYSSSTYQPSIEINLGEWYVPDTRTYLNCYAFALGINANISPGYFSGTQDSTYTHVETIRERVENDLDYLGIDYRRLSSYDETIDANEYIIGMRTGYNPSSWFGSDYHFIRRNFNEGWFDKFTMTPSSFFAPQRVNPVHVIWCLQNPPGQEPYDVYYGDILYLAIKIQT